MSGKISSILTYLARLHPSNRRNYNRDYPQLWWVVTKHTPYKSKRRRFIQWLCGKLTNHELSKTEWGYGGGKFVDCNCRWCNRLIRVPIDESPVPESLKSIYEQMDFEQ